MVNSPRLRFFNHFRNKPTKKEIVPDAGTVQGWLMNVHTYRDESIRPSETHYLVDGDNNCIPIETNMKEGRAKSIISIDSVNLEELINNNFTTDMDDETDLAELANLDLDDSKDDFWGDSLPSFDHSFHDYLKSPELDWSPNELSGPCRSDSFSSENSLTSHSSLYAKYGMVPLSYPSESSSTSSRSHSRLSSYSASSHQTAIPTTSKSRERPTTSLRKPTTVKVVTPITKAKSLSKPKSTIAKRASHIPFSKKAAPTPQKSTSTSSSTTTTTTSSITTTTNNTTASSTKVAMSRITSSSSASSAASNTNYNGNNYNSSASSSSSTASRHIQSSRPGSPLSLGYTQSRIAIPKSSTGDRRTSYKRVMSPVGPKPSGILPPGSMGHSSTVKRV